MKTHQEVHCPLCGNRVDDVELIESSRVIFICDQCEKTSIVYVVRLEGWELSIHVKIRS